MIPLRDNIQPDTTPFITYGLIAGNIVVFIWQLIVPDPDAFVRFWALVPAAANADPATWYRFVTSMFLHGGFLHVGSNMLFLHVFGDNVEDRFGHIRYLVFYLFWGVAAGLAQYVFISGASIPVLGASGAVAGVMGAYFVLFKHSKVETLVPTFFGFLTHMKLPAQFMLFYWFIIQVFSGTTTVAASGASLGGVAWFAHIGGFAAGWFSARFAPAAEWEHPIEIEW